MQRQPFNLESMVTEARKTAWGREAYCLSSSWGIISWLISRGQKENWKWYRLLKSQNHPQRLIFFNNATPSNPSQTSSTNWRQSIQMSLWGPLSFIKPSLFIFFTVTFIECLTRENKIAGIISCDPYNILKNMAL